MPRFHQWQKPPPAAPELVFCDAIKTVLAFPCIFIHIHPHKHPNYDALIVACSWLVHWTCLMVVALRRTTLSGNGIEGSSGLNLSPSSDIFESRLYAKSQFVTEQETPQTRSIALSAAGSLYMGTYTPKHSLVWMHRGFRFLPCPLPAGLLQSYFPPFWFFNVRLFKE